MRCAVLLPVVILSLSGCVTPAPPPPKIAFEEAMSWNDARSRALSLAVDDPKASEFVAGALERFVKETQAPATVPTGAPIPETRLNEWNQFLEAVDVFLAMPGNRASMLDSMRIQLRMEDALHEDAQRYGDLGDDLVRRVHTSQQALIRKRSEGMTLRHGMRLIWPVLPVQVNSPFGERVHPIHGESSFHHGVDLAAHAGQPVIASADGFVEYAAPRGGHGNHVQIRHSKFVVTRYSHLQQILVESGETVRQGDVIGLAGSTGDSTGPHLHFQLEVHDEDVDPVNYLPRIVTHEYTNE